MLYDGRGKGYKYISECENVLELVWVQEFRS